ncbi:hypothetical protein F5Y15DRAFT_112908 [Xylariaceae sp. FL0016]|nr:hypothetical protein F5Y15DRAFT_112908 [Xylariaceae sp. FL0016]
MPAIMDDPSSPTIHRVSGATPYPDPKKPELPPTICPRHVTLRDRQTIATIVPFVSRDQVPTSLLAYLSDQFAKEIEGGDTYPMIEPMPFEKFSSYWLQNFAGVMLLGQIEDPADVVEGKDWSKECLGSFYIKPNYPGRSSHVCNAGFLVTDASRNRGVGRLMGETYLDWAPKLGYSYSVFNLVYETNVASCRIWDALGFKRIGRVKGCGNLKSYPDRLIDAIIYGRELGTGAEGGSPSDPLLVSEERFDKIKFYLKYGRYPNGSDRAEKSRLRSAATHYKLLDNDVLMLKDKEVISDPIRQMAISRKAHEEAGHAGINKTTSAIAEKHHWSRIKETVSDVIRTCDQCKDLSKNAPLNGSQNQSQNHTLNPRRFNNVNESIDMSLDPDQNVMSAQSVAVPGSGSVDTTGRILDIHTPMHHHHHHHHHHHDLPPPLVTAPVQYAHASDISSILNPPVQSSPGPNLHAPSHHHHHHHHPIDYDISHHDSAAATLASLHEAEMFHPIDPQIISQPSHEHHPSAFQSFHPRGADVHAPDVHATYLHAGPVLSDDDDVPIPDFRAHDHDHHRGAGRHHDTHLPESFQALLHDVDASSDPTAAPASAPPTHLDGPPDHSSLNGSPSLVHSHDRDQEAMDRDLDMLIEHPSDDDDDMDLGVGDVPRGGGDCRSAEDEVSLIAGADNKEKDGGKRSSIYDVVYDSPR